MVCGRGEFSLGEQGGWSSHTGFLFRSRTMLLFIIVLKASFL